MNRRICTCADVAHAPVHMSDEDRCNKKEQPIALLKKVHQEVTAANQKVFNFFKKKAV